MMLYHFDNYHYSTLTPLLTPITLPKEEKFRIEDYGYEIDFGVRKALMTWMLESYIQT